MHLAVPAARGEEDIAERGGADAAAGSADGCAWGGVVLPVDALAHGGVVAILEHNRIFQRVEGRTFRGEAVTRRVVGFQELAVVHEADAEGVEAALDEAVLAAVAAHRRLAAVLVVKVRHDCLLGEDLDRPKELAVGQVGVGIRVLDVERSTGRWLKPPQVVADTRRQECTVRICLNRPVVLQIAAILLHLVPDLEEDLGVHQRRRAGVPAGGGGRRGVEDRGGVAGEDALLGRLRDFHQCHLLGVRQHRHEAEQRRACHRRPRGSGRNGILGAPAAKDRAPPALGQRHQIVHPSAVLSGLHAARIGVVLDDAREAGVAAALLLRAILAGPGARRRDGRALALLLAGPALVRAVGVTELHAGRPLLALLEALHAAGTARGAAALGARAIFAGHGAGVQRAGGAIPGAVRLRAALLVLEVVALGQALARAEPIAALAGASMLLVVR
mmetsp:Transcript_78060/g.252387  ORF Transcript_78060/g.252387 Transcript_78060/m.252387 type:complete len:445 (+) Transcript_78060:1-1335(+)